MPLINLTSSLTRQNAAIITVIGENHNSKPGTVPGIGEMQLVSASLLGTHVTVPERLEQHRLLVMRIDLQKATRRGSWQPVHFSAIPKTGDVVSFVHLEPKSDNHRVAEFAQAGFQSESSGSPESNLVSHNTHVRSCSFDAPNRLGRRLTMVWLDIQTFQAGESSEAVFGLGVNIDRIGFIHYCPVDNAESEWLDVACGKRPEDERRDDELDVI
jgi:hypothetical protein